MITPEEFARRLVDTYMLSAFGSDWIHNVALNFLHRHLEEFARACAVEMLKLVERNVALANQQR
jgi:hypothetical protein